MKLAFKILTEQEWRHFEKHRVFEGSEVDRRDGFIHLSYASELQETALKHFSGRGPLMLVTVDATALGPALQDEISRGGLLFPHLYRSLQLSDMLWHRPIALSSEGRPILPEPLNP